MTKLLETALLRLRELPETEQDAIAERILADLEDENRWNEAFARSQDVLSRLAKKRVLIGELGSVSMPNLII